MRSSTLQKHKARILPVLVHIEENLSKPLELIDLASRAGFSPYHFHRVFSSLIHENPKTYIRRLRLERAVYQMKVSPDNVLDIGLDAGFNSHESFTRAFMRHFKMSPADFRDMLKEFRQCVGESFRDYSNWEYETSKTLKVSRQEKTTAISLEQFPEEHVLFTRYRGQYEALSEKGRSIDTLWGPLFDYAEEHGLVYDRTRLIGICHDDPYVTEASKIRFDACLPIQDEVAGNEHIGQRSIESGLCAVRRHNKGFEEIANTFAFIGVEWLPIQNYMLKAKPHFEVYECKEINGQLVRISSDAYVPLKNNRQRI